MHIYYRFSDKSYLKPKLPVSKNLCLWSFYQAFRDDKAHITLIVDNCEHERLNTILNFCVPHVIHETNLGNSGSFLFALDQALTLPDEEIVYIVEDDYVHHPNSMKFIEDAPADYWTLYDHPDKYGRFYNMGERSQLIRTKHSHWKYSVSTTMTFAAKVKTLKEDAVIWQHHCQGSHPHDHLAFKDLQEQRFRELAVCIPGMIAHTALDCILAAGKEKIDYHVLHMILERMRTFSMTNKEVIFQLLTNRLEQAQETSNFNDALEALKIAATFVEKAEQ